MRYVVRLFTTICTAHVGVVAVFGGIAVFDPSHSCVFVSTRKYSDIGSVLVYLHLVCLYLGQYFEDESLD